MMKMSLKLLPALLLLGAAGCAEVSPEPESATRLTSARARDAIRTEEVTVRAAFVGYASLKEFHGARCTFTRGRQKLQITTPEKVSFEIRPGKQPDILLECEYAIGAGIRTSSDRFEPKIKAVTNDLSKDDRVYSDRIAALFLQR